MPVMAQMISVMIRPKNERTMMSSDTPLSQLVWNSLSDDGRAKDNPHNPIPIPKATASTVTILAKRDRSAINLLMQILTLDPKIDDKSGAEY